MHIVFARIALRSDRSNGFVIVLVQYDKDVRNGASPQVGDVFFYDWGIEEASESLPRIWSPPSLQDFFDAYDRDRIALVYPAC